MKDVLNCIFKCFSQSLSIVNAQFFSSALLLHESILAVLSEINHFLNEAVCFHVVVAAWSTASRQFETKTSDVCYFILFPNHV